MIALVGIISTSVMLHNYHFFLIFAIVRCQSPSQFDDENTYCYLYSLLCIRFLGLISCWLQVCPRHSICPTPPPQPLVTIVLLSASTSLACLFRFHV